MRDIGNKNVMAKNIKHYMKIKDVNAKELSNAIKVPYTTVLSWINAEYYPRIDKIEKMSDFFGCLKSDLIEDKTGKTIDLSISDLTPHEQEVITQYRAKPHLQEAVDKLLDVPSRKENPLAYGAVAAEGGKLNRLGKKKPKTT